MNYIVLREQVKCPICKRSFTGIVKLRDDKPFIECVNRSCRYLIFGSELDATVGQRDLIGFEKLASGKWPSH